MRNDPLQSPVPGPLSGPYYVGIDGGGTRTTLGICDAEGNELLRRIGPAGLVDPKRPTAAAELLVTLVEEAARQGGLEGPATAMCAGLAGVANEAERAAVEATFRRAGIALRVAVISDGEIALHGALGGGPGILVIAGTGSVAHGRAEDGRVERCGGWGMTVGDEGSGYAIGRAGLCAALLAVDGRGPETQLREVLFEVLGFAAADAIPPWVARSEKADVALLAVHVLRLAEQGDPVAREIVAEAALDVAAHVDALVRRLGPWSEAPAVVLHGGVVLDPYFRPTVAGVLERQPRPVRLVPSAADAVSGALEYARSL